MKRLIGFINFLAGVSFLINVWGYAMTLTIKRFLVGDLPLILKTSFLIIDTFNPFKNISMTVFLLVFSISFVLHMSTEELLKRQPLNKSMA